MEALRYAAIVEAQPGCERSRSEKPFQRGNRQGAPPLRRCSRQGLGGIAGRRVWLPPPAAPPRFGRRRSPDPSGISRRVLASPLSAWRLMTLKPGLSATEQAAESRRWDANHISTPSDSQRGVVPHGPRLRRPSKTSSLRQEIKPTRLKSANQKKLVAHLFWY